jgi:hypothetical protein
METIMNVGSFPIAFGVGIVTHFVLLKHVELEIYLFQFLGASILSFLVLIYYHSSKGDTSATASSAQGVAETICFVTGIFSSMAIYRLFFHRIHKFPGPFWAKLTRFYALRLSAKNVQYHVELERMHEKYGEFIRTGKWLQILACNWLGYPKDIPFRTKRNLRPTQVRCTPNLRPEIGLPQNNLLQSS